MPVKIRLSRRGRKKLALYDIIVADSRSPRDGKFIEKLGTYNPGKNPAAVILNADKAFTWIMNGAQPTDTVRTLLKNNGVMLKKHLQVGVNKGAITQEAADKKLNEWKESKEKSSTAKIGDLASKKETAKADRLAAEAKVNKAREEAIKIKNSPIPVEAEAPAVEETAPSAEGNVTAEASAEPATEEKAAE